MKQKREPLSSQWDRLFLVIPTPGEELVLGVCSFERTELVSAPLKHRGNCCYLSGFERFSNVTVRVTVKPTQGL